METTLLTDVTFTKNKGTKVRGSILADQFRRSLTYRGEQIIAISNVLLQC